jgi:hypothetical protein
VGPLGIEPRPDAYEATARTVELQARVVPRRRFELRVLGLEGQAVIQDAGQIVNDEGVAAESRGIEPHSFERIA